MLNLHVAIVNVINLFKQNLFVRRQCLCIVVLAQQFGAARDSHDPILPCNQDISDISVRLRSAHDSHVICHERRDILQEPYLMP